VKGFLTAASRSRHADSANLPVTSQHGTRDPRTNVTNDDPELTARIAWAHLLEIPDYYTRLDAMEAG
jgi:hypothetical protein